MTQLNAEYVQKADFNSLVEKVALHQKILFGAIGAICIVVLGALLTLVVKQNGI